MKKNSGHTLVELLVAMGIIAGVGGIMLSVFFLSLRGSTKTDTLTVVRQNGNNAIAQIGRLIRNARRLDGVSEDGLTNYKISCVVPTPVSGPTPTPIHYLSVKVTSQDPGQSTFICNFAPGGGEPINIASASSSLPPPVVTPPPALFLDTSVVTITPGSCYFTCFQEIITQNPVIGIHFGLSAKNTGSFPEKTVILPFETSVTVRNRD